MTEWIAIGKVTGVHGNDGGLVVTPLTDYPERFRRTSRVTLTRGEAVVTEAGIKRVSISPGRLLVWTDVASNREEAARLIGCEMAVERAEVMAIPEGHYYIFDIVGMRVQTTEGRYIGRIREVMKLPANDVYVVENSSGGPDILIPAIRQVVTQIDVVSKTMTIHPMEGLLEDEKR